jgi:hypothetical protein
MSWAMLLRLLTMGLGIAMVVVFATWQPVHVEVRAPAAPATTAPMSVVDVAHGVAPVALASLLRLLPGERITAINDRVVDRELGLDDDVLIASLAPRTGEYIDLTVASAASERRVLLLVH